MVSSNVSSKGHELEYSSLLDNISNMVSSNVSSKGHDLESTSITQSQFSHYE